ncbi:oxidoreductase-like protein [Crucibulum laeve]|uniref:Oxidoreductase-like protein n=1 Tax=Crucibulum laeve TaxID=68775 RepID=A0A5C3LFT9_9AGAR|nr:oxidoreductase-like protein [Crucibulum laeve]
MDTHTQLQRLKYPNRGGRNLTDRYIRLEKSLRGKEALAKEIDELELTNKKATTFTSATAADASTRTRNMFRGFYIPEEPKEPEADECCMSGCAICVYDLYEDSMTAYKESIEALRASLSPLNVPEAELPASLRTKSNATGAAGTEGKKNPVLSAFEEMERALKAKHSAETGAAISTATGS